MVKRFLITTADERTWRFDCPVLFLGEWCKLYDRRHIWTNLDADVVPYHWDDRNKFYTDYCYLMTLYEQLLSELTDWLNRIHSTDHSIRYWRILIGPWLGYFIQMSFDRWAMVQKAIQMYEISGSYIFEDDICHVVPNDMSEFNSFFIGDRWNQAIYSFFLEHFTEISLQKQDIQNQTILEDNLKIKPKAGNLSRLYGFIDKISGLGTRPNDAFFFGVYLPLRKSLELQFKLGQFPRLWKIIPSFRAITEPHNRKLNIMGENKNQFEIAIRLLIPLQIPSLYLEGYKQLVGNIPSLPWPENPKFIYTSVSQVADDIFKSWLAEKVETGIPLVISQHGGHYGSGRFSFHEEHEISICDRYFSWGWKSKDSDKVIPLIAGKLIGRKEKYSNPNGYILLVTAANPRYSSYLNSTTISSQWLDYFSDQCHFISALPEDIKKKLIVRLYQHDYGWDQMSRYRDRYPDVYLDPGICPIEDLIRESQLCVVTNNATTFLETLVSNTPTIIFWNPKYWELREDAIPFFDQLKKVGILHVTPESAAQKVNEIWNDVASWWNQSDLQKVRLRYCNSYARVPDDPMGILKRTLISIKHDSTNPSNKNFG